MGSNQSTTPIKSAPSIASPLLPAIPFAIPEILQPWYMFDATMKSGTQSSTGIGIVRDDKYANLGTSESRRAALKSISLQAFLDEAMDMNTNGGPREDQEISFNCGYASKYPLQFAAMLGDMKRILYLIRDCGIDPNIKCSEILDTQPISYCARYGHLLAVIALLKVCLLIVLCRIRPSPQNLNSSFLACILVG